jgi:prephenate dehydrogenase
LKIAIVGGSGKMGKWFASFLSREGCDVTLVGRDAERLQAASRQTGVSWAADYKEMGEADAVLLSVAIDSFGEVVRSIAPYIRAGQIVADITSIKAYPVRTMHRYLKKAVILPTHPLFGPGARDVSSQNFVLTPTGEPEQNLAMKVQEYLVGRGARVIVMSPREHDEMMSVVLGLAHFISIVSADTLAGLGGLSRFKSVGGSTYRVLITLVESVISEDPELYATLQMRLPGLAQIEDRFQKNAAEWAGLVKKGDRQEFARAMGLLKSRFASGNSGFGDAYTNMYKIMKWL